MNLDEIEQRALKAKPDGAGEIVRMRYDHGGGRMYQQTGVSRNLILDVFEEDSREFYFQAREDVLALCERVKELEAT